MNQLIDQSRPTVNVTGLIEHINDQVLRFGSGSVVIPFWTGQITVPDPSVEDEFVSIRMNNRDRLSLVHTDSLPTGPAELKTNLSDGTPISVPIEIVSCAAHRTNWFQSSASLQPKNRGILSWRNVDAAKLIRDAKKNKRSTERQPYHCPAVLQHETHQSVAYVRDISKKGIGLTHRDPINTGLIAIDVYPGHDDEPLRTHVFMTWCTRSVDMGYRSGGYFVDMAD